MSNPSTGDVADRIVAKRARISLILAVLFIATQAAAISAGRANGHLDIPFLIWVAVLITILLFGGAWFRGSDVRQAVNDETTVAHRRQAMASGFLIAVVFAVALYGLSYVTDLTVREAVRLLITFTVAGALLKFAKLERRALRG